MKPLDLTDTRPLRSALRRPLASLRKLAPALLLSLAPLLSAGQTAVVHAASGDCTTSGSQITCTFSYTGAEQSWQVPPGVSSAGHRHRRLRLIQCRRRWDDGCRRQGGEGERHRARASRHDEAVRRRWQPERPEPELP